MGFNSSRWMAKLRMLAGSGEAAAWLDYDKKRIQLGVSSEIEYHTRLHSCKKEPETIEWIERCFSPGDVFYDVGANVGAYSLVAASYWEGAVRVVAFEPGATNFARLVRNLVLNRVEHWITPLPVALAEKTGLANFHYANLTAGGALHALNSDRDFRGQPFHSAFSSTVLAYDLDTLIDLFHLPPPTHLKLDVDGTEWEVLQGARRALESVRSLLVELDSGHPQTPRVTQLLNERGFQQTARHPYRYGKQHPRFSGTSNVIFSKAVTESPARS